MSVPAKLQTSPREAVAPDYRWRREPPEYQPAQLVGRRADHFFRAGAGRRDASHPGSPPVHVPIVSPSGRVGRKMSLSGRGHDASRLQYPDDAQRRAAHCRQPFRMRAVDRARSTVHIESVRSYISGHPHQPRRRHPPADAAPGPAPPPLRACGPPDCQRTCRADRAGRGWSSRSTHPHSRARRSRSR